MLVARPWDPSEHWELARGFLACGKTFAARQEMLRTRHLGGNPAEMALLIGVTVFIEGRDDEAIAFLESVRQQGNDEAAVFLAAAYARRGDRTLARELVGSLRVARHSPAWFWHAAAVLSANLGGIGRAVEHCRRAIHASQQFFPARLLFADILSRHGKNNQAEKCLRDLYHEQPRDAEVVRRLAEVLGKRGATEEARRVLQRARDEGLVLQPTRSAAGSRGGASGVFDAASLVAWRCSFLSASARYAQTVRELTISASAIANARSVRPASAVLG
ncbi:MAG: hypothetical protein FJ276_30410, partial [Planctomycetes bacterium]|nr:hypothetical protein [Planctomycetota bacterium]